MTTTSDRRPPDGVHRTDVAAGEVADAVELARAAAAAWRATAASRRAGLLREAAAAVRDVHEELGGILCLTTGRLLREARASAAVAADLLEEAAVTGLAGGRALAGDPGAVDLVRREPRGVVAAITPWNDPYPAAAGLIAAALVTGNTVVHKPSERSADPGRRLTEVVSAVLPEGVLVHVGGDADAGRALARHPLVDLVAHIGSSEAGASVRTACAGRGAVSITENGGKDPLVVDAGVDPRWAARQVAVGAFTNAGQLCTSVERVYLHADVADDVVRELVRLARGYRLGHPADDTTTLPPLVDERAVEAVHGHVRDAVERGARLLTGGEPDPVVPAGYPATVLVDCTDDMLVMTRETFGPVAPVVVVGSWDEGLERAAGGAYGLAATVLTTDTRHALEAAERLDVGTVKVNAVFGGAPGGSADPRGLSGRGVGFGPDLLREMTVLKTVHLEPAKALADDETGHLVESISTE
ncbi:aldehyde dehydrogenase family protein [Fodinibacter luteus]